MVLILCRCFGTTYRSHLHERLQWQFFADVSVQPVAFNFKVIYGCNFLLTIMENLRSRIRLRENDTDRLSRNASKVLPL
jgi:hypothetical protein